jgi:cardiolipin synthase
VSRKGPVAIEFLSGNRITLLEMGSAYFPALIEAIDAACDEVHLESYIFEADATGQLVAAALCRAARRGARVRLMVDGFGARDFMPRLGATLVGDGVDVMVYRPEVALFRMRRHRLRRLHRKLAVIDGRIAFVGGINVIDDSNTPGQVPPRYDYAVCIEGPLVATVHGAVHHLWQLVRWASFRHRTVEAVRTPVAEPPPRGDVLAAFVIRDNLRHRRDIEDAYLEAIAAARHEIILAHAYFLPGQRFRHALMAAASRGVKVVVLLQGRVEYLLLHYAAQALYGVFLDAGVRLFEYRKSFLHAKVAVIDGEWATVGSSNIDPFSLLLAREANVIVRDQGFAVTLRHSLQRAIDDGAAELRREHWRRKSRLVRAVHWLAYGMVRMMIGIAGYGGKH